MLEADNLRRVGADFSASEQGRLSIAATHSQARYALPHVVRDFRQRYPQVRLHLHQGSPEQVAQMLRSGEADIGVATEALAVYANQQDWVGLVASRPLAAGQALRQNMLRTPALFAVGAEVRVLVNGGGFSVTSSGKAMSAAGFRSEPRGFARQSMT